MAAVREASASSAPSPTVIGRRRLSSPACAAMGSLLPSSSWTDQRRMAAHLCREGARTDAAARRHRDLGQSQLAQGRRRARDRRGARRQAALPRYSPDLNPIEQLFAKLKALLRKAAARTVEALWTAVATLLTAFSTDECANYFANAGNRRSSRKRSGVPFPLHSSAAAHSHCGGIAKRLIGCLQRR